MGNNSRAPRPSLCGAVVNPLWERGEAFHALQAGMIPADRLVELGAAIADARLQRQSDDEITIVDLTGVAVQDIQISKAVWRLAAQKN